VDLRLVQDYCDLRGVADISDIRWMQDEIIVLPGDYACEVKDATINKNSLLAPENVGAIKKLWTMLETLSHHPSELSYEGYGGGLYGLIHFDLLTYKVELMFEFMKPEDNLYALKYGFLSIKRQNSWYGGQHAVKTAMPVKDPDFYNFVNHIAKYLVHRGEEYMNGYYIEYEIESPLCKDKCNPYRDRGIEVFPPYMLVSSNMTDLVYQFVSDVMAFKRSFNAGQVVNFRGPLTNDVEVHQLEAMVELESLRLEKELVRREDSFPTEDNLQTLEREATMADMLWILEEMLVKKIQFTKEWNDFLKGALLRVMRASYGANDWSVSMLVVIKLILLYKVNPSARQVVLEILQQVALTKNAMKDAMRFFAYKQDVQSLLLILNVKYDVNDMMREVANKYLDQDDKDKVISHLNAKDSSN